MKRSYPKTWRDERVVTPTTMRTALEDAIRAKAGLPADHNIDHLLPASGLVKVAPVKAPKAKPAR